MLPTLSSLSVSIWPGNRLRYWCSSRYLRIPPLHLEFRFPLPYSRIVVSKAGSELSPEISPLTYDPAYTRFTPSNSGQRLLLTCHRGCWHVISRSLFVGYNVNFALLERFFFPQQKGFTTEAFITHAASHRQGFPHCGRFSTAASRRSLGRSQSQCGRTSSQTGYPSSPW